MRLDAWVFRRGDVDATRMGQVALRAGDLSEIDLARAAAPMIVLFFLLPPAVSAP